MGRWKTALEEPLEDGSAKVGRWKTALEEPLEDGSDWWVAGRRPLRSRWKTALIGGSLEDGP